MANSKVSSAPLLLFSVYICFIAIASILIFAVIIISTFVVLSFILLQRSHGGQHDLKSCFRGLQSFYFVRYQSSKSRNNDFYNQVKDLMLTI